MFALVGLGNPGERYTSTRHNAGFWVVEALRRKCAPAANWRMKGGCSFARGTVSGLEVLFARPERYMNLSGEAVQPLLAYFKIEPEEIVVVHDELDIPTGEIRLKRGGGDGGHRGVADLARALGSKDFYRVRLGIGRPQGRFEALVERSDPGASSGPQDITSWVLGIPRGDELGRLEDGVSRAVTAVELLLAQGIEAAQREFNRKLSAPEGEE